MKIQGTLDSNGNFVSNDRMPIAFETNGAITVQGTLDANGNFIQATHQPPAFQANGNLTVQGTISSSNNFVRATRSPTAYNIDGSYKIQGTLDANGNFVAPVNPNAFKSDGDISIYGRLLANGQFITPTSKVVAIKDLDFFFGADTPAGEYLNMETSGLAIDFAQNSALVRDPAKILSFSGDPVDLLTYTSPSPKMVYGADGVLRYARHNRLPYSQDFDNVVWTKGRVSVVKDAATAPDGTQTADLIVQLAESGVYPSIRSSANVTAIGDRKSKIRVRVKAAGCNYAHITVTGSQGRAWFDLANVSVSGTGGAVAAAIIDLGNGWRLLELVCDNPTAVAPVWFGPLTQNLDPANPSHIGDGVSGIYAWGIHAFANPCHDDTYLPTTSAARYDMPINHDPVTFEAKGVLIEEQRTNLLKNSGDLREAAGAWGNTNGVTSVVSAVSAPDGINFFTELVGSPSFTTARVQSTSIAVAAATTYTASIFLKKSTSLKTMVAVFNGGPSVQLGSIEIIWGADGVPTTVTSDTAVNVMYKSVGNGIYRVSFSVSTGTETSARLLVYPDRNATSLSVYAWGAQLEAGAFPTSYIPTTSAQVTRAADNITLATSAFPYNQAEGTLVADRVDSILTLGGAAVRNIINFWDGTGNNRIRLYSYPSRGGFSIVLAGTPVADMASGGEALTDNVPFNIAGAYKVNDCAKVVNSTTVVTDNSVTLPTVTTMTIGSADGSFAINGHIRRLKYLPRRATNSELQAMAA